MSELCRARWYVRPHEKPDPQCTELADGEVEGVPLCWVHRKTVEAGNATLGQVVRGERTLEMQREWASRGGFATAALRRRGKEP